MPTHTRSATLKRPTYTFGRAPTSSHQVPAAARERLGHKLRDLYAAMMTPEQPSGLVELATRLDAALKASDRGATAEFQRGLLDALPGLRTFALSLTVNSTLADDLVQETLLKAWANRHRFQPGTKLMAWLCTIMRNHFYTEWRKRKREVEDVDGVFSAHLTAPPAQEDSGELRAVWGRMAKLPPAQREALVLVALQGMTYEAAADLIGTQVGTVKSRVSRARAALAEPPSA